MSSEKSIRADLRQRDLLEPLEPLCAKHGCTVEDLASASRSRHIVAARRDVAGYLATERGWSTPSIGKLLGGRDHTTILNLLGRVGARGRALERAST